MIVHRLPRPDRHSGRLHTGIYADHTLYTGTVEEGYDYPEHRAGLGIFVVLSGNGQCRLNQQDEKVGHAEWLLIDRGSLLSLHLSRTGTRPVLLFFDTQMVERLMGEESFAPLERVHSGEINFHMQLEALAAPGNSCSSFVTLKADSVVRNILEELIRQARQASMLAGRLEVAKGSTRIALFKRLSAARDWMLQHYHEPIILEDMAEVAMLHRQHFLRMFRQCYRLTPHQYLTETRLLRARQLLLQTEDSVLQVCQQTGFESPSSFSGLFSRRFGLSPAVFRRSQPIRS
ncbi:MAG TPA: AraC family transcriptional regulator [Puia sp.]|nr:AraC family transcriptional regulator [Puia sp.]